MENYTALVLGATGATGIALVRQLILDEACKTIKVFVRKPFPFQHVKLEAIIIDFDKMDNWSHQIKGDVLYSALGTTLKQAGSKDKQYTIDFTYQYNFAKLAAANQVGQYVLVSSLGASKSSLMFYPKMKGELEEEIKLLSFKTVHIFQPGILERNIEDGRFFENLAVKLFKGLNSIGLLKSQKPMPVATLAKAMMQVTKLQQTPKINFYKGVAIFEL